MGLQASVSTQGTRGAVMGKFPLLLKEVDGKLCVHQTVRPSLSLQLPCWGPEGLCSLKVTQGAVMDKFPDVAPRALNPVSLEFLINTVHLSEVVCRVPKSDTFPYK